VVVGVGKDVEVVREYCEARDAAASAAATAEASVAARATPARIMTWNAETSLVTETQMFAFVHVGSRDSERRGFQDQLDEEGG
jgi:ethanolamine ammonia-lyase small subunit